MTNLTNQQLIDILSQRNPDDLVDIYIDWRTFEMSPTYPEYEEHENELCYNEMDDKLVINVGYFE